MIYVDSSAVAKLVFDEPESGAFLEYARHSTLISSALTRTEVLRAVTRFDPALSSRALAIVQHIEIVAITGAILESAAKQQPPTLRTLDAIQLATALALEGEIATFISYDARLLAAAAEAGLAVASPGVAVPGA